MRILVIGSGGREHALGWRLAASGHQVFAAPGNPGLASIGELVPVPIDDHQGLIDAATSWNIELVVVGPEAPLVAGLADSMRAAGLRVFGPGKDGARLEGSKAYSKEFFARHDIRTSPFKVCSNQAEANAAINSLGGALVVKVDGLAAGKGVIVCDDEAEARAAVTELTGRFGDQTLVIERKLPGRELSVMGVCDGSSVVLLAQAEDHKQLLDGDRGPNTGGMGTVSPAPWASAELLDRIEREIFAPTLAGLSADNIDYRGVLYAGLMVDESGVPWLLEYNCRFGDPETQPVLMRLRSDLGELLARAADGNLGELSAEWDERTAVCVTIASAGYPASSEKGVVISGLDRIDDPNVVVFHAGTARTGDSLVTAGGRVLGVAALGENVSAARDLAYAAVSKIELAGAQYRTDIGARGVQNE